MRLRSEFARYRAFLLDVDGVVWLGGKPIPGAPEALSALAEGGRKVVLLTNNSTRSREEYAERLRAICDWVSVGDIVTSGYATAAFLRERFGRLRVYVIGEMGLVRELSLQGHVVLSEDGDGLAEAVVVGLDRQLHYSKLRRALRAIARGALFVATNEDATVPAEGGAEPGAGSIVAALSTAAGRGPDYVVGKPSRYIFEVALRVAGASPSEALVIGDRVETDIVGARRVGAASALVLTGVTRESDLDRLSARPDYVLRSLADLFE